MYRRKHSDVTPDRSSGVTGQQRKAQQWAYQRNSKKDATIGVTTCWRKCRREHSDRHNRVGVNTAIGVTVYWHIYAYGPL